MSLYDDLVKVTNKAKEDVLIKADVELEMLTKELTKVMFSNAAKLKTSAIYNITSLSYPALFSKYNEILIDEASITSLLLNDLQGILGKELEYGISEKKHSEYVIKVSWSTHKGSGNNVDWEMLG